MSSENEPKVRPVPKTVLKNPNGPWTEKDFPFPYIKAELDELHNTVFKYGCITELDHDPNGFPKDTAVKILEEEGHEYDFIGQGAHDAITHAYIGIRKYQHVHFFANEKTKAVVAILMEFGSWPLPPPNRNLRKPKLKQHSARLMLVLELERVEAGDWDTTDDSDISV